MPEELTSEQLTELALRARTDRDALDELIAYEVEYVTSWVRRNVNYRYVNDMPDITQDILFAIANAIPGFEGKSSFARWCGKLMYHRLGDWFRRMSRRTYLHEDLFPDMKEFCGTCEMADRLELEESFNELLEMASPGGRENLRLRFADGYKKLEVFAIQDKYLKYEGFSAEMRRDLGFIKYELERRAEKSS